MEQGSFASWWKAWSAQKSDPRADLFHYEEAVKKAEYNLENIHIYEWMSKEGLERDIHSYKERIEKLKKEIAALAKRKGGDDQADQAWKDLEKINLIKEITMEGGQLVISTKGIYYGKHNLGRFKIKIFPGNSLIIENLDWIAADNKHRGEECYHPHIWLSQTYPCMRDYADIIQPLYKKGEFALMVIAIIHFLGNFTPRVGYMTVEDFVKLRKKRT